MSVEKMCHIVPHKVIKLEEYEVCQRESLLAWIKRLFNRVF